MVSVADFPLWSALTPLIIVAPWIIGFGAFAILISLFKGGF